MTPPSQNEVTQLLLAWSDGNKATLEELTLKQAQNFFPRVWQFLITKFALIS